MQRGENDWMNDITIIHETCPVVPGGTNRTIIETIDDALQKAREFLKKECLDASLQACLREFNVTVHVTGLAYAVDLAPRSGEGHDFSFRVDKATGLLDTSSLCTGEVIPEPD